MTIQVRKASRKKAKLRLGIAAPSGAGKTMGALLMAYGITGDWGKVGLIDTEAGSGELYVGASVSSSKSTTKIGEYLYVRIDPDYTVSKYIDAMRALEDAGVECIIVDSASHAWSGEGGLLDKQGRIADQGNSNSYTAWRKVTPDHNKFVDTMLGISCHLIVTMRSKQEYVLETNSKGKQAPRKVGMAPVQREGMEYEFTVMLDVDASHSASASKDRTNTLDGRQFTISPEIGRELLDWLETGKEPEKDLKQLAREFSAKLSEQDTLKGFEACVKEHVDLTGRMAKELPDWHEKAIGRIKEQRKFLEAVEDAANKKDEQEGEPSQSNEAAPKTEAPAEEEEVSTATTAASKTEAPAEGAQA